MHLRRAILVIVALACLLSVVPSAAVAGGDVSDAKYRLRHGLHIAKRYYEHTGSYAGFDAKKAERMETNLGWIDAERPTDGGTVDIQFVSKHHILLLTRTVGSRYFCIFDVAHGRTHTARGHSYDDLNRPGECKHR